MVDEYVVHVDHGIGRYIGLVRRSVDGFEREYLTIEYADDSHLFVPVHQADRLTRYVGPDNRPPTLSRLGSSEWRNVKAYVKEVCPGSCGGAPRAVREAQRGSGI